MKNRRLVHRAAYKFNNVLDEYELTVCGKTSRRSERTSDDNKVTCPLCKTEKEDNT